MQTNNQGKKQQHNRTKSNTEKRKKNKIRKKNRITNENSATEQPKTKKKQKFFNVESGCHTSTQNKQRSI